MMSTRRRVNQESRQQLETLHEGEFHSFALALLVFLFVRDSIVSINNNQPKLSDAQTNGNRSQSQNDLSHIPYVSVRIFR